MVLNTEVFQEPRGVMRVIQFIFAIWAFAKTVDYYNEVTISYCSTKSTSLGFTYPYHLDSVSTTLQACQPNQTDLPFQLVGDFSSDAQFFVATGVLSMLYCIGISICYVLFNEVYVSNSTVPMADFLATLVLAVFWLSGSAAWANGIVGLKAITDPRNIITWKSWQALHPFYPFPSVGSFSGLNISITLGFLNFFLWAFDLWFLYKETQWFKDAAKTAVPNNPGVTAA